MDERKDRGRTPGIDTTLTHAGLDPFAYHGFVNPPLVRASTVLFPDVDTMLGRTSQRYSYGLTNTPTVEALTKALDALEGSAGTVLVPSGLAAVTTAILAAARPGSRILVPDNVYGPTRRFCDESLPSLGMTASYYDPTIGAGIAELMQDVSIVFLEAPGSTTFEMPDLDAIVAVAKAAGAVTMIDNTWATPLIYRPLEHGIDFAIYAGTKYFAGHSDLLIGSISANERMWPALQRFHKNFGIQAGTEEIWLTLRGLRTMSIRLERHDRSGMEVARWLQGRPEVSRVLHPALPEDPGHELWKRDFGRSCGLFAFVLNGSEEQAKSFLNALRLFGLGYSWGGFESLAVLGETEHSRTARPWTDGPVIRLHIGLEDVADIIADLEAGFAVTGAK
ncbi:cystathionine beta-lyase [Faunimonas pinastri]|uniref:Cystathionine beta-lyase n=1 Tax=Faunimonas pinastri TaxID=1855383 RepID=A0A1H9CJL2_9HYPH|nr:cystathionine beta-lyase [Faunimonas pinastri]SEQ01395.1 cystathionine beta-lyase [Faunimonas pinastri]